MTELDVNSKEYDKVTIAGIDIINEEEVPIQSDVSNFRSDYLTVGENPVVHFENSCDVDNLKQIVIQADFLANIIHVPHLPDFSDRM